MNKIIVVDFAGTLIKPEIIEEANEFRAKVLEKAHPTKDEHAKPEELYKNNREFVEKLTGIQKESLIQYRQNDLQQTQLNGEQVQNQIATNLFQIGMFQVANKYKENIFPNNLIKTLTTIKSKGYKLAIVSGVREDIISGMLSITNTTIFDFIFGQPPILGVSNEENVKELQTKGIVTHIIGDKLSDLEIAKNAKTVFVTWGHASGGEKEFADYTINTPEELETVFQ